MILVKAAAFSERAQDWVHSWDLRKQRVVCGNVQTPYHKEVEVMLIYSLD